MIRLFVIADDFTGALDTGVQFASYGAATKVVVYKDLKVLEDNTETQVLVVDAETRHLSPVQAYNTVYGLVKWAKEKQIACIYKKTDSVLRGNIGAELDATLAASGQARIHFVPAFPKIDRITRNGIHYIDGIPVAESVFGKDPFDPVVHSRVEDILHEQTDRASAYISSGETLDSQSGIIIYEAQTNRDMAKIADDLAHQGESGLLAGCAGFASVLPRLLRLSCRDTIVPTLGNRLLAVCGSINPVSMGQCDHAEAEGAPRFRLTPEQKLSSMWASGAQAEALMETLFHACTLNPVVVLDTGGMLEITDTNRTEDRIQIVATLGSLVKQLLDKEIDSTILIMGGDCLLGLMSQLDVSNITPLCEIAPGVVLSQFTYRDRKWNLISKSGGFGEQTLFYDLQKVLQRWENEILGVK